MAWHHCGHGARRCPLSWRSNSKPHRNELRNNRLRRPRCVPTPLANELSMARLAADLEFTCARHQTPGRRAGASCADKKRSGKKQGSGQDWCDQILALATVLPGALEAFALGAYRDTWKPARMFLA